MFNKSQSEITIFKFVYGMCVLVSCVSLEWINTCSALVISIIFHHGIIHELGVFAQLFYLLVFHGDELHLRRIGHSIIPHRLDVWQLGNRSV